MYGPQFIAPVVPVQHEWNARAVVARVFHPVLFI